MSQENNSVKCAARKEPAIRLFVIAIALFGFGFWCWSDKAKYPAPEVWDMKHANEVVGYVFNHYMLYVCVPVGIFFAIWGFIVARRVLVADDAGLGYLGKRKYAWSEVELLDASQLKGKGLLYVTAGGKRMKLDSWKLDDFKALVAKIETNVPDDKKKV